MSRFTIEEFFMPKTNTCVLSFILKTFFRELYHHFAWSYDAVAYVVSMGKWQSWVRSSLQFIEGDRILELGYGPGHLQVDLALNQLTPFGIDESMFMAKQAQSRYIRRITNSNSGFLPRLVRGDATILPFANYSFHSVVATFPTEYILNPTTLIEIMRVITPGGKLIILLSAWPAGKDMINRVNLLLFRLTQQSPAQDFDLSSFINPFNEAGLPAELKIVSMNNSELLYIFSTKPPINPA
jgi:ubiquinone/menaquinone biosynthesis C-methylase UbiE